MKHIYEELEKCRHTLRIHKFSVIAEGEIKTIYHREFIVAIINMKTKKFYTKYKLMGDVILFSKYLRKQGYQEVKTEDRLVA